MATVTLKYDSLSEEGAIHQEAALEEGCIYIYHCERLETELLHWSRQG